MLPKKFTIDLRAFNPDANIVIDRVLSHRQPSREIFRRGCGFDINAPCGVYGRGVVCGDFYFFIEAEKGSNGEEGDQVLREQVQQISQRR